ncbi:MAG: DUF192 domain-containing protein [Ignavibacteria bacterium]|nr:DUF192 domain-containing protein [Ignavibacteria bacterium]
MKQKGKSKSKAKRSVSFWNQRNIIILIASAIVLIAVYFFFINKSSNEPQWVKEGELTILKASDRNRLAHIEIEVASNPTERQQGLMYRSHMDEDKGMLFIFDREEMQAFWMKNTIIPLDIIFISSKGVINTIHSQTTPFSEKSLPSKIKSQFVLEVNGGFCQRHGIKEGDLIEYKLDHK